MIMHEPVVSVCMITYNHAQFIEEAIHGILNQKTDFPIELVIGEDCSTDSTREIIERYQQQFSDIIRLLPKCENLGVLKNFYRTLNACSGKYIALCEGDDCWTDPLKLQKQVDFLESHPDYSLCFHNAMVHYEDRKTAEHIFADLQTREYHRQELLESWLAPTASFVFLKDIFSSTIYQKVCASKKLVYGDLPLILSASYCGKIYGIHDTMSIYRKHSGGVMQKHSSIPIQLCIHQIESRKIFQDDLKPTFNDKIGRNASIALSLFFHKKFMIGIKLWWIAAINAPFDAIKWSIKYFYNAFIRKK